MSQSVSIGDIAEVRSGYTFRRATSESDANGLLGLHIGDIRETSVVDPSRLSAIEWQSEGRPPVLEPGDVVFAAKGSYNRAAVFRDEESQVVPSNQFLVLRVRNSGPISPEFLCWTLNYKETQRRLAELQSGTSIFSISKKALQIFTVSLPPRETQNKLLRLNALWEEERRLSEALIENGETMVQGMFQRLLTGAVE
ncbi:restriction endonuclease subunit S [Ectothiorhodospiraceae bacterium WFHF3C12]|nr:restriction endonuclease subunit S [Ectothiorhodospiraceae bacterium WFHF3C12]